MEYKIIDEIMTYLEEELESSANDIFNVIDSCNKAANLINDIIERDRLSLNRVMNKICSDYITTFIIITLAVDYPILNRMVKNGLTLTINKSLLEELLVWKINYPVTDIMMDLMNRSHAIYGKSIANFYNLSNDIIDSYDDIMRSKKDIYNIFKHELDLIYDMNAMIHNRVFRMEKNINIALRGTGIYLNISKHYTRGDDFVKDFCNIIHKSYTNSHLLDEYESLLFNIVNSLSKDQFIYYHQCLNDEILCEFYSATIELFKYFAEAFLFKSTAFIYCIALSRLEYASEVLCGYSVGDI